MKHILDSDKPWGLFSLKTIVWPIPFQWRHPLRSVNSQRHRWKQNKVIPIFWLAIISDNISCLQYWPLMWYQKWFKASSNRVLLCQSISVMFVSTFTYVLNISIFGVHRITLHFRVANYLWWWSQAPQDGIAQGHVACRLFEPSRNLNRCWYIVHGARGETTRNFISKYWILIQSNTFEKLLAKWWMFCPGLNVLTVKELFPLVLQNTNHSSAKLTTNIHPSPNVMADFFRHKNQHDALIQFSQSLVDLWSVC